MTKPKQMHLCRPCSEALQEVRKVTLLGAGKTSKQTCGNCQRRRYCLLYRVEPK